METTVSLVQMLDARERRVQHQQELLARYHKPLICFTMNICGPVKDSPLIRRGFGRGRQLLRQQFLRAKLTPLYQDAVREVTGCEAFYVLDTDPLTIKKFTACIVQRTEDAEPAPNGVYPYFHPKQQGYLRQSIWRTEHQYVQRRSGKKPTLVLRESAD